MSVGCWVTKKTPTPFERIRHDAAPVGRRAHEVGDVEPRLAEELRPAVRLEADERAQQDADGLAGQAADALELGLGRVRVEEGEQRTKVREVDERQALGVGVVKHEPAARLLGLVRAEGPSSMAGLRCRSGADSSATTGSAVGITPSRRRPARPSRMATASICMPSASARIRYAQVSVRSPSGVRPS
jgi:hypothetical protein